MIRRIRSQGWTLADTAVHSAMQRLLALVVTVLVGFSSAAQAQLPGSSSKSATVVRPRARAASSQSAGASIPWARRVPNPPEIDRWATTPDMDGVIETYVIVVPETGALEAFTIYAPDTQPGQRVPVLMAFHAYGVGWLGIQNFSGLIPEAIQRGWFLVAPWQRNTAANANVSYASVTSQLHVEAVMDLVLHRYRVDRDRVYGIGFSMGGGNALSYAARHRDRREGAIAAVVNHTGSVALANVYANVTADVRGIMDATFGGDPASAPFEYRRSSVIELDAAGALLPGGRHMGLNLANVPVQSWFNTGDSLVYLREQTQAFHDYMESLQGTNVELRQVAPFGGCDNQHCWDTLDRTQALNWLAQFTLDRSPLVGTVLVDRPTRWGAWDVFQAIEGSFTEFDYEVDPGQNLLALNEPSNLAGASASIQRLGLRSDMDLSIRFTAASTGGAARIRLEGWLGAPAVVTRNGITQVDACPLGGGLPGWCYDGQSGTIEIVETTTSSAFWEIRP
ncbi:MAG: hypothetical protein AAGG01_06700 [Planctomycetota bacterium]